MVLITTRKPYVPFKRLNRLATRGLRVVDRYRSLDPTLDVLAPTFTKAATEFQVVYSTSPEITRTQRLQESHACVADLRGKTQRWLALLSRDCPGRAATLRALPHAVDDDALSKAKQVVKTVDDLRREGGLPLPYAERLIASLSEAIEEAGSQLDCARVAVSDAQEHGELVRRAATALQAELVSLRKILRSLLGSRHVEYQRLRAERGVHYENEEEEEEVEPNGEAGGDGATGESESSERGRRDVEQGEVRHGAEVETEGSSAGVLQSSSSEMGGGSSSMSPAVAKRSNGSGEFAEEPWGVILEWLSRRRCEQDAQLPDDVAAAVQRLVGSDVVEGGRSLPPAMPQAAKDGRCRTAGVASEVERR